MAKAKKERREKRAEKEAKAELKAEKRFYDAGRPTRATAGWRRPFTSARSETYSALPYLRAGSHDLVRNNPHGAKILGDLAKDLVGTGIIPRADTGSKALNRKVDKLAAEVFRTVDVDGITKNYPGFQLLAARSFFEGGEAISRRFARPARLGLRVPIQFALMEGEFVDNQLNVALANGNRIVQGVEFDPVERTRDAYWMFKDHPGDTFMAAVEGSYERVRVPADEVAVLMEPQRPGQVRGVPWLTPVLVRAKLLDDYEDAERQRKRIESSISLVVKSSRQLGEGSDTTGPTVFPSVVNADGELIERVEAGGVTYARDADDLQFMKPAEATAYVGYKRSELQSIAAGARSTHELASGDLSQTSFSSIQFGSLNYRGMIDVLRATMFIPFLEWHWRCFIDMAIAVGALPPQTSYGVKHHCPPWPPLDPLKAAEANKTMMRSGEKTLYGVVTAGGKDFGEHLAEIKHSNDMLDRYGLVLDSDPRLTDGRGVNQAVAAEAKGEAPKAAPAAGSDPDAAPGADGDGPDGSGDDDAGGMATPSED